MDDEMKVKKCLKSYLTAKKYYESDTDKSFEYFKQCIKILNDIKDNKIKIDNSYLELIDETETECSRYITMTIENTMNRSIPKSNMVNTSKDELFEMIEKGSIDKLKAYKYGEVDFKIYNNNGLSPLHFAISYGDTTFLKLAFKLGANVDMTNTMGHTLLEFACLERDPNMISFLNLYGANMKKHLEFRDGNRILGYGDSMDIMLLEKYVLLGNHINTECKYLNWIGEYIDMKDTIDIQLSNKIPITNEQFILRLDNMISEFPEESRNTYLSIIKEELDGELNYKLGCPNKKIEILLYNLVPFIDFKFNLSLNWLLSLEIKFIILKILKNKVKINTKQLKEELKEILYLSYIKTPTGIELAPEGMIQILVLQWMQKIKV